VLVGHRRPGGRHVAEQLAKWTTVARPLRGGLAVVGLGDLVGALPGDRVEGAAPLLREMLVEQWCEIRVAFHQAVDRVSDRADEVGTVDVALHRTQLGGRGGSVGAGNIEVRGVGRHLLGCRRCGTAALRMSVEADLPEGPAVPLDQRPGGTGCIQHGVGLVQPVHVGVQAGRPHPHIVGDDHAHTLGRPDEVVESLERNSPTGGRRVGLVVQRPVT